MKRRLLVTVDFEKVRSAGKEEVVLTLLTNGGESFDSLEKKKVNHSEQLKSIG